MRQQNYKAPKLPRQLLDQIEDPAYSTRRGRGRNAPLGRKERRKAEREQKKTQRRQPRLDQRQRLQHPDPESGTDDDEGSQSPPRAPSLRSNASAKPSKSILKRTTQSKSEDKIEESRSSPPRVSQSVKNRLAEDDAEIAALEKKLGLKGKRKLPKSFEEDGLDVLLDGLNDDLGLSDDGARKRKRVEDDAWLESKRRKSGTIRETQSHDDEDEYGDSNLEDGLSGSEDGDEDLAADTENSSIFASEEEEAFQSISSSNKGEEDDFEGFESDITEDEAPTKTRENPYVAPVAANALPATKYIPLSLRAPSSSDAESMSRLRRQTQGLLNRLSEANILSILRDVENLYQTNPRQYVTSTLIDLLLGLLCDRTSLMDTFLILHAGFIAASYKVIGTDFGAQFVERITSEFDRYYADKGLIDGRSKEASNLMALVSELYNFQVIGATLVFDYIRLFLEELSEVNTELLLRIIKNSGPQLRQDDPSALKDIVVLLQKAVAKVGETNLSVRTKFMIETINNLKNNRVKTGAAASSIVSEHTIRMKKMLGSINNRNIRGIEPLRIGLHDVRDTDKRGKWWLVGASWKNNAADERSESEPARSSKPDVSKQDSEVVDSGTADLVQLAREQRMNTDVRRAIFITIMSASDYKDAHLRLLKLKLKRAQELEVPRVLIHCAGAEQSYNPYYTLIARRLCSDHRLKMAFQFSLWDLFKRMGEKADDDDTDLEEQEGREMGMRKIVNLARMFGSLIADGGLSIAVLKTLNFAYLQPKTNTFAEVLLVTIILQSQKRASAERDEDVLLDVVMKARDAPQMTAPLQYFLKKVVAKADIAANDTERGLIKWGCRVAGDALSVVASAAVKEE